MSELKDFYNNLDKEVEDDEAEEDSDFVPEDDDDDQDDRIIDEDADHEEEDAQKEAETTDRISPEKKSRIDAIWAEMNQPAPISSNEDKQSTSCRNSASVKDSSKTNAKNTDIPAASTSEPSSVAVTPATTKTSSANAKMATSNKPIKRPSSILNQYQTKNKRPKSQLSALISKYNIKEPKMNTLEKSKLDWNNYVEKEGIKDELSYKNKDGYMEKVAFLQRVDDRRLSQLKEGQKSSSKKL